jgi:hypothetical protein
MSGSFEEIHDAIDEGHIVIISIGGKSSSGAGYWGHVMVIVGHDESSGYQILDPGHSDPEVVSWTEEELKEKWWWYGYINPMWIVGEED